MMSCSVSIPKGNTFLFQSNVMLADSTPTEQHTNLTYSSYRNKCNLLTLSFVKLRTEIVCVVINNVYTLVTILSIVLCFIFIYTQLMQYEVKHNQVLVGTHALGFVVESLEFTFLGCWTRDFDKQQLCVNLYCVFSKNRSSVALKRW